MDVRGIFGWVAHDQPPDVRRTLRRSLALIAVVTLITAYFSEVFYKPDEHFQVLEFLSYKLGRTSAPELPWEFHSAIRPWMQPWLYFLVAKPLLALGVQDPFTIVFVLQILTALASLAALAIFAAAMVRDLASL